MKRSLSFGSPRHLALVVAGTVLIATTYGLVRLAFGLFLPDVQAELGLSTSGAGYVSSGASLSYCVAAVVGFVAAATRPRALVAGSGLAAVAGSIGMAAAPGPQAFAVAAVIGSAGAGLASPAMVAVITRSSRPATRERDQSFVNSGTGPGLVGAGILGLVLLPDWRLAWFLAAVATVAATSAVLAFDRDREMTRRRRDRPSWAWFASHRELLVVTLAMGAGSSAVWSFGRAVLVDAGLARGTSVVAWIVLGLGGAAVITTAGRLDRLGPSAAWGVTTGVAAVATGSLGLGASSEVVATTACAAFGWGFVAATGALIVWTSQIDLDRAPAGTSMLFVVLVLGQAVGAPIVGWLIGATSHGTAFLAAALVMLVAGLVPRARSERVRSQRGRKPRKVSPSS